MKQQKIQNTNNGITLIALVITIIVMLILVAVTISMAVNGGLFDYAGKATGDTKNELSKEGELGKGGVTVNGTYYNSIDEYLQKDEQGITAKKVQNDLASYVGKEIDYNINYENAASNEVENYDNRWDIFYADENHIYIITKGMIMDNEGILDTWSKDGFEYKGISDFTEENIATRFPAIASGICENYEDWVGVEYENRLCMDRRRFQYEIYPISN